MSTIKRLLLFSCLALLGGCATPCPPAGTASYNCDSCWYKFEVTALFPDTDEVEGLYSKDVQDRYGDQKKIFRFHVENVAMKEKTGQLKKGKRTSSIMWIILSIWQSCRWDTMTMTMTRKRIMTIRKSIRKRRAVSDHI